MPSPRWTSRAALLVAGAMTVLVSSGGFTHAAPGPEVFSWGANNSGQLGNGTSTDRWAPGPVTSLARGDTAQIAAGGTGDDNAFAVARLEDKTVRAWGHNSLGQLGDGSRSDQAVPDTVPGLTGVTDVAAGGGHALAVRQGRVLAWGDNNFGQLGNGRTGDDSTIPVPVQGITSATQVAAGCDFSLALQDGAVWAWGRGSQGQRGQGDADLATDAVPQPVTGLTEKVVQVAAGCHHALARTESGKVYAWGDNLYGQLGNGTNEPRYRPVTSVRGSFENVAVSLGGDSSYAY
ncbi:RCC1 domain-containing protein [Streptomyces mirabilis]